jgi:serine/threonine protein kinase
VSDLSLSEPLPPTPSRFLREDTVVVGSVASTYLARDRITGHAVALTLIHPAQAVDPIFVARFERETRLLASIDHPNVVRLTAYGSDAGVPYFATRFVPGRTLAEVIRERGALSVTEAVTVVQHVLAGLGAIHAAGMLHLRLAPEVVLVGEDGVVRIAGTGIAALGRCGELSDQMETIDAVHCLAPEQIEGGDVSEATDLYAVGLMLFEALTGQRPFPGTNPVLVRFAHLHATPPAPSQIVTAAIPRTLDEIVLRALAKDPTWRYDEAQVMAEALAAIRDEPAPDRLMAPTMIAPAVPVRSSFSVPKPSFTTRITVTGVHAVPMHRRRAASNEWMWPLVLAVAAIVLLIGGLVASLSGDPAPQEAVAGVSIGVDESSSPPTRSALTPTVRVLRGAEQHDQARPTATVRRVRAPVGARTPAQDS